MYDAVTGIDFTRRFQLILERHILTEMLRLNQQDSTSPVYKHIGRMLLLQIAMMENLEEVHHFIGRFSDIYLAGFGFIGDTQEPRTPVIAEQAKQASLHWMTIAANAWAEATE